MLVAKIALDVKSPGLRRTYEYSIPAELAGKIEPGSTIIVPLRGSEALGYVVDISSVHAYDRLKSISAVVSGSKLFGPNQIALSRWLSEFYISSLSEALKLTMPPGARHRLRRSVEIQSNADRSIPAISWLSEHGGRIGKSRLDAVWGKGTADKLIKQGALKQIFEISAPAIKTKFLEYADIVKSANSPGPLGRKQHAILEALSRRSPRLVKELLADCQAGKPSLTALSNQGMVRLFLRRSERLTATAFTGALLKTIVLNEDQQQAFLEIKAAIESRKKKTVLLDGVTGSGKTEIYIRAARECLRVNRAVMFLVPEIALLPQLVERLALNFGESVAVLHSGLPAGERFDAWQAVASGRKKIIVGARSALFAPAEDIGMIVLDEEHETSYKQNSQPRYDARTVAAKLADLHGAVLLMGSATPSLETRLSVATGGVHLRLKKRVGGFNLPSLEIVDMRDEHNSGNFSLFSAKLSNKLVSTVAAGHQAILLINRRGFSNFILCRECGYVPSCDNCEVSLTYHRTDNRLHCHHCNAALIAPDLCPQCRNTDWRFTGAGTQRVESELRTLLGDVPIIRMDADTTTQAGSHHRHLLNFHRTKGAVLLGTQMIAKGLDFPSVALVGIVNADTALNLPDFRAAERTAQLLVQVSGRSGRGSISGEVVIQTYNPDNYAIQAVMSDYSRFCLVELGHRRELNYPPYSSMINLIFSSPDEQAAESAAAAVSAELRDIITEDTDIFGPAPAPIAKIKGYWRQHLVIMSKDAEGVKSILKNNNRLTRSRKNVKIIIDVDPVWLL